jgi:hypothetical protein
MREASEGVYQEFTMYMRFVINRNDEDSGKRLGVFHAARDLRESGDISRHDEKRLLALRDWFDEHLEKPTKFTTSKKPHAKEVAISWFKDSAKKHIAKMYEMIAILEAHGIFVEVVKTSRPGYIVYEDKYQVTAEPYAETET